MRPELDQRGIDFDDLVGRVLTDPGAADIPRTRRAMLNYARKLTATPSAMTESDIHELRAAGFEDRDVLAIAEVVAYYA